MQKRVTSFDGTKINYDISRRDHTKGWLFFIHGVGGDLAAWRQERTFFHKRGYSTVAIDLRGHGKSDRPQLPRNYALENFARDIKTILSHERIRRPVLVGHSFGGMLLVEFHKLFPTIAKKYVFVDSAHKAPSTMKKIFVDHPLFVSLINYVVEHKELHKHHFTHAPAHKYIGSGEYNIERICSDISHTTFKSWLFTYESLSGYNGIKVMKTIKQPVLVVEGDKDTICNMINANKIHSLIKHSKLSVVSGGTHIIVLNNPKELEQEILHFIS